MKKNLFFFLLFTFHFPLLHCKAQNLVPNPGFEDTTSFPNCYFSCPYDQGQVCLASHWNSFANSPDYYNSCSLNFDLSTPSNMNGYQIPASGDAYVGIFTYTAGNNIRDYVGAELNTPLEVGMKYFVSFKACMTENPTSNCANDKIGVLFTTKSFAIDSICDPCTSPCLFSFLTTPNFSHIYTNQIITDTANWTTISGSFIADSTYRYIIIGNFFDDINTLTQKLDAGNVNCGGYYYIDDIYVSRDSLSSIDQKEFFKFNIYPNPADDYFTIFFSNKLNYSAEIEIFSSNGSIIIAKKKYTESELIPVDGLKAGLYFISVNINGKNYKRKLIVNR